MKRKQLTPEAEHEYLKSCGSVRLLTGFTFILIAIIDFVKTVLETLKVNSTIVFILLFIVMIFVIIRKGKSSIRINLWFTQQAWFGSYDDEFLNYVSLQAYRVSFFVLTLCCLAGVFGMLNSFPYSLERLFLLLLGLGLTAYGATVTFYLRVRDE